MRGFKHRTTEEKLEILFYNLTNFMKEKNRLYGDSAIEPIQIFSKLDSSNSICIRIDDKISRIKNNKESLKKNDIVDLIGYLSLYLVDKDWLTFNEMLD